MITIYTDGACSKNGKEGAHGGFGVVVTEDEKIITCYSKQTSEITTNNREEMKSILYSLLMYGNEQNVIVYSDSAYAVNTFNTWMYNWAKNNWVKSDKKTPENLDLVKTFYEYVNKGYKIDLRKIKGHAGHKFNEMADGLATGKIKDWRKEV